MYAATSGGGGGGLDDSILRDWDKGDNADRRAWHDSIGDLHGGYQEILREGLRMFGCGG
jgi:hypothetical protein